MTVVVKFCSRFETREFPLEYGFLHLVAEQETVGEAAGFISETRG